MRVAILGAGPTGLIAAHAASQFGTDVEILSLKRYSPLFGAQYIGDDIDGIDCGRPRTIKIVFEGTVPDYRRKVYGENWGGEVSPETFSGFHDAWNIRQAYSELWELYSPLIKDQSITPLDIEAMIISKSYDLIFNSIPAHNICHDPTHQFRHGTVWAAGDAPELGIQVPAVCPRDTIAYNGNIGTSWYRASHIFGHSTIEWPDSPYKPWPSASLVKKPLATNCDCWPDVHRIGRYGRWEKGYLVRQAYDDVHKIVEGAS